MAATLITPDSGLVEIEGTPAAGLSRERLTVLRREKIGMVFQQPNLIASLTAAEQLEVMAHLDGHSTRKARRRALSLLGDVGLSGQAGRRPHQLSGGPRQRVNIARALMNDPAVLLVDEPTSALDHGRGAAVVDLLAGLTAERGVATVLVTHDRTHLGRADQVADGRLAILSLAWQFGRFRCRLMPGSAGQYRGTRANSEQTCPTDDLGTARPRRPVLPIAAWQSRGVVGARGRRTSS